MNRRLALLLAIVLAPLFAPPVFALHHHPHTGFDLKRPEIVSFVNDVVARDQLKRKAVLALLAKAEPQPKIIELMTRPAEKVTPWWEYHDRFLTEERIDLGVQFWMDHRQSLERIATERGVPPEYLIEIGRASGRERV